jgi:Domain of unknown function (DUF4198)
MSGLMRPFARRLWPAVVVGWVGLLLLQPAQAHDTWFEPRPSGGANEVRLALGTGARFPALETAVSREPAPQGACRWGEAAAHSPLWMERESPAALVMRAESSRLPSTGHVTCWATMPAHAITLDAAKVAQYFDEIKAPETVRQAWRQQKERGLPFQESFTKLARIEHRLTDTPRFAPVPMGLDIVLQGGRPAAGEPVRFQVLRQGQPFAGLEVELISAQVRVGFWLRTDAQGMAEVRLPLGGRWLLRATELKQTDAAAGKWESRFITLAFESVSP